MTAREAAKDNVENPGGSATAYLRFAKDDRIRFRAVSISNPKGLDKVRTHCALFQGTYDSGAGRWTGTDARPISANMFDTLLDAYANSGGNEATPFDAKQIDRAEQEKAEAYDRELNEVYSALHFILPKTEFEKVKAEQVKWLKQRDAAHSIEEKNQRVQARVKALGDLLW